MNRMIAAALVATFALAPAAVRAAAAQDAARGQDAAPAQDHEKLNDHDKINDKDAAKPTIQAFAKPATRPMILPPLYISLGALQAYDGYSTLHGVKNGAQESNAIVGGLAGKPAAFWAVKAGSTALSIYMAERLWRDHHRGEAIVTMIVANGVMAAIAARNTSILRSTR